jgi:hypothetical protein
MDALWRDRLRTPTRVVVAGVSGVAQVDPCPPDLDALDPPYTEIDGLYHGAGWMPAAAIPRRCWSSLPGSRPDHRVAVSGCTALAVCPRGHLVWFLDLPSPGRRRVSRAVRRTIIRSRRRIELWKRQHRAGSVATAPGRPGGDHPLGAEAPAHLSAHGADHGTELSAPAGREAAKPAGGRRVACGPPRRGLECRGASGTELFLPVAEPGPEGARRSPRRSAGFAARTARSQRSTQLPW